MAFAEHVILDLKRLEPAAWVFWQAVENLSARDDSQGSNWGLIKADLSASAQQPHTLYVTKKYWVMAQFSRYIQPGYRLVPVDDLDTVAALSPNGQELVLVHVNGGLSPRQLQVTLPGWHRRMVITDQARRVEPTADLVAPARSVATMILTRPVKSAH